MGRAVGGTRTAGGAGTRGASASPGRELAANLSLAPVDGIEMPVGPLADAAERMLAAGQLRRHGGRLVANWGDEKLWKAKLTADRERAAHLPLWLRRACQDVVREAAGAGASSVVLFETGVTEQSSGSDIDMLVVGAQGPVRAAGGVKLLELAPAALNERVAAGDIAVHTALREGLVLHDRGPVRAALLDAVQNNRVPSADIPQADRDELIADAKAHLASAPPLLAQRKVRDLLAMAARQQLLRAQVLPGCRASLPGQLSAIGQEDLAAALVAQNRKPKPERMRAAVELACSLLGAPTAETAPEVAAARPESASAPAPSVVAPTTAPAPRVMAAPAPAPIALSHQERLAQDPIYAKAYRAAMHQQRMASDPVYAQAYERALAAA